MPLIRQGYFDDLTVRLQPRKVKPTWFDSIQNYGASREVQRDTEPTKLDFPTSGEPRGLALQSLKLLDGFEGFLKNLFNTQNEIFFLSWAFDLSGAAPTLHPETGVAPENVMFRITKNQAQTFLGKGALLFPPRPITSGLVVRIQVWEDDKGVRDFGATLDSVISTIHKSKLAETLKLLALAGGPSTATLALVESAAEELGAAVADVLKHNSDDMVDLYEGFFPVADDWKKGPFRVKQHHSEISLTRL